VQSHQPDDLVVDVRHLGKSVEIAVGGELDIATAPELRRRLATVLRDRPEIAVVDLRQVAFIDSSGIHALLASRRHAIAAGTHFIVIRPTGVADRVFTLSGLAEVFPPLEHVEGSAAGTPESAHAA
jgi:anti-anti-sigma factor